MKIWTCGQKNCGHVVLSKDKPDPIRWTDGHICYFIEGKEEDIDAKAEGCSKGDA